MNKINLLFSTLLLAISGNAFSASSFSSTDIESAITIYYNIPEGTVKEEVSEALADEISILKPISYNSVIAHLAADYRNYPDHRSAIASILQNTQSNVYEELKADKEESGIVMVIDNIFRVWTASYAFGFGKGLWKSSGSGLKGLKLFQHTVEKVAENLPKGKNAYATIAAGGITLGITEIVYHRLETKRLNPTMILYSMQEEIMNDLALIAHQSLLQAKTTTSEQAETVQKLSDNLKTLKTEVAYFYKNAPQLRAKVQFIAEDMQSLEQILLQLDSNELVQGMENILK